MHCPIPPGEIFQQDFRSSQSCQSEKSDLRLLQWNIERGYQLDGIIKELKTIDADILSLQEIDIGCERSRCRDCGIEIAQALALNYVFLCEFEELRSPNRDQLSQGGGVHGNAIMTKYDITDIAVVPHRIHPVDWNDQSHPLAQREPRRGQRAVLRCTMSTPQGPFVVYCAHLEVFCGMLDRIAQLADILLDSKATIDKGYFHQAILGDLNTMAHGIARLSPSHCCDMMRFRSIGYDEASMWQRYVIEVYDARYLPERDSSTEDADNVRSAAPIEANKHLVGWGMEREVALDALNPAFSCPFDEKTITLDNPKYKFFGISLMAGKLDWMLVRRVKVLNTKVGNDDYALSDHKWLSADVMLA